MSKRKPQPNYLPFFGPYKRDLNAPHSRPSRFRLSSLGGDGDNYGKSVISSAEQPGQAQLQPLTSPDRVLDPVRTEIVNQAKAYGVPLRLAAAVAKHESNFKVDLVNEKTGDYGVMQVNDRSWFGNQVADKQGFVFTVDGDRVKTDWKYNVRVGMAILRDAYQKARLAAPNDVVRATHALYNASPQRWREYTIPGRQVHKHVQQFMRSYNSLAPW
jgi:soluble lytic murein transglycosylase-like protein